MNRRDLLKAIPLTTLSIPSTATPDAAPTAPLPKPAVTEFKQGKSPEEQRHDGALQAARFLTAHELATVTLLCDIILPADARTPSASQVGVPQFIEFMLKDQPDMQTPIRGGLSWVDHECRNRFGKPFAECTVSQRIAVVDDIAYPAKAKHENMPGVAFFTRLRNLTAAGYFTSKAGIAALGYMGNTPHQWAGPPKEVLDQFGLSFDADVHYADMS
ncbi:gluconate 2-dehydrogenase subunit 3 family protein [Spirosoma foliorum]|uniref:Gluconate 2-dehydrogenase subunit 3 family protein n=1 Tax=Spirosoma foliorum TaxID=2710596 RepID=A0A7G5H0S2_9BACT|nr:gluconate 2-dehydrogenase subunit 3 family protein [Spirosoma foliorum]QMW04714.1 gluconate 2-dehydrogenase subunit 3 family protein [Spirosoma foliorum]